MKNNQLLEFSDDLITVLSQMDNKTDILNFLRDLLTQKEILEFSRRLEVAKMLEDRVSYTKIEEKTNMSSTTIARVSKFLNGENTGYKKAISILKSISDKHHTAHQT